MSIIASSARHRAHSGNADMSASSRVLEKDEELGRRSEDYWRHSRSKSQALNGALPWRKRRLLIGLALFLAVYVLFRNLSLNLWPSTSSMYSDGSGAGGSGGSESDVSANGHPSAQPTGPPPRTPEIEKSAAAKHYYSDLIQFYNLAGTLEEAQRAFGYYGRSRNVLFAASSLQSLANILPVACEMQRRERNRVHIALFGRDSYPLKALKQVNGIDQASCDIFWHDARPDYAEYSTDERAETGATFALKSFYDYISPQVLLTDDLDEEDAFFKRSVTAAMKNFGGPLIQIPKGSEEKLEWMARLDVESLKKWDAITVDILIHAEPRSIGSLQRLMRSLEAADYKGLGYPRLIVELATDIDPTTRSFLERLRWPPESDGRLKPANLLTIRHRISRRPLSAEEASVRFLESYYPSDLDNSHVLVLSANAEVSPLFYHFIKYNILEYRYGPDSEVGRDELIGFSLDLPATLLDGSSELKPPTTAALTSLNPHKTKAGEAAKPISMLWQAPHGSAAVYFGEKWVELQSYVTNRIDRRIKHSPKQKEVSTKYPAWMEYFMELIHARGYSMIYPHLQNRQRLVTLHLDSAHLPEEYDIQNHSKESRGGTSTTEDTFVIPKTLSEEGHVHADEGELVTASGTALHQVLPLNGVLPALPDIPLLSTAGEAVSRNNAAALAEKYAAKFRLVIGGCDKDKLSQKMLKEGRSRIVSSGSAKDLFCWGDEEEEENYEAVQNLAPDYGFGIPDSDPELDAARALSWRAGMKGAAGADDPETDPDTDEKQAKKGKGDEDEDEDDRDAEDEDEDDAQADDEESGGDSKASVQADDADELEVNAKALKRLNAALRAAKGKQPAHGAAPVARKGGGKGGVH